MNRTGNKKHTYVSGEIIGVLEFIERAESEPGTPKAKFRCRCGKEFVSRIQAAKSGDTKSCGCHRYKFLTEQNTKHEAPRYTKSGIKLMPKLGEPELKRFWAKIIVTENPDLCWNWIACGDRYGYFKVGKGDYKANRVAYYIANNEDPEDMVVMHSCDNPKCCNPKHLSIGTQWENMQDMASKKRANPNGHKNKIDKK